MNVLTVGKHPIVREGLKYICAQATAVAIVGEAQDVEHALSMLEKDKWDVVVLDNNADGFEQIKAHHPNLPVIVMSADEQAQRVSKIVRAGAAGYLAMDSTPDEVISAIEATARGETYITPTLAQKFVFEVGVDKKEEEPHKAISKREFQVMALIGSGRTLREIGEELQISTKTVSVHRDRILKKMKMKHNAELIRYVLEKHLVE